MLLQYQCLTYHEQGSIVFSAKPGPLTNRVTVQEKDMQQKHKMKDTTRSFRYLASITNPILCNIFMIIFLISARLVFTIILIRDVAAEIFP